MLITSPANERIKHARRVRDGREPGWIFVEGERLVEECLQTALPLHAGFYAPEPGARAQQIIAELQRRGCQLWAVTEPVLNTLSDTVHSQGIVLLAGRPATSFTQMLAAGAPLLVGLDAVQDPGNLGTIVRTAEAAGVHGVLALLGSTDAYAPKTLRGAMGSAFRLPLLAGQAAEAALQSARQAGLKLVATLAQAALSYDAFDWRQPVLVLFGNEARGLSEETLAQCDAQVSIPLRAPVESLNVAAAAAVVLFEAARQRRRS